MRNGWQFDMINELETEKNVIFKKFSLLVAPESVIFTTSCVSNEDDFVKMTISPFRWNKSQPDIEFPINRGQEKWVGDVSLNNVCLSLCVDER